MHFNLFMTMLHLTAQFNSPGEFKDHGRHIPKHNRTSQRIRRKRAKWVK